MLMVWTAFVACFNHSQTRQLPALQVHGMVQPLLSAPVHGTSDNVHSTLNIIKAGHSTCMMHVLNMASHDNNLAESDYVLRVRSQIMPCTQT